MLFRVTGLNNKGKQIVQTVRTGSKQEIISNPSKYGFASVLHTKQLKE